MTAMEGDGERPLGKQLLQTDEASRFVWQHEGRHLFAGLRRVHARIMCAEPLHERIDSHLKMRTEFPDCVREGGKPLAERRIHITATDVGVLKSL